MMGLSADGQEVWFPQRCDTTVDRRSKLTAGNSGAIRLKLARRLRSERLWKSPIIHSDARWNPMNHVAEWKTPELVIHGGKGGSCGSSEHD